MPVPSFQNEICLNQHSPHLQHNTPNDNSGWCSLPTATGNGVSERHNEEWANEEGADLGLEASLQSVTSDEKPNFATPQLQAAQQVWARETTVEFRVYYERWIMLLYISILNLLSDWTCYSVAPIATLTTSAFESIHPDQLVVVFLAANAISTAFEPMVLSRLGLRRTVVLGALLLMMGSIIKSNGFPPILKSSFQGKGNEWRVYLGFFLVGLSQPLYQCTPALLSASWFPERERTLATGLALNANQLGIGIAFFLGPLLVRCSDDLIPYFGILSMVSTITFVGSLLHFADAPPSPPSGTARVVRGSLKWPLLNGSGLPSTTNLESGGRDDARPSASFLGTQPEGHEPTPTSKSNVMTRRRSTTPANMLADQWYPAPVIIQSIPPVKSQQRLSCERNQQRSLLLDSYRGLESYQHHSDTLLTGVQPSRQEQNPYSSPRVHPKDHRDIPEEYPEPSVSVPGRGLEKNIRDDQLILSTQACFARSGFIHAVTAFAVSGIVLNTLSTFMDYLIRLDGGDQGYVGLVGGSFQLVVVISGLVVGKQTDRTRAYYGVTIALLVSGAFALAECGVSLDAAQGGDLRWALLAVAALVGPLQPVSTELGVEVAFPLSENTVLVIQQLFSNLLSALFIPLFKALRAVGTEAKGASGVYIRPHYTFSFYLLIVLHAFATVFFATFNGRYFRREQELSTS